jgi:transposase-like protein
VRHYSDDEKRTAIKLYFSDDLTSQQVVDRLGYSTQDNAWRDGCAKTDATVMATSVMGSTRSC